MSEQYDPKASYDVIDPEGLIIGRFHQGHYFEGASEAGNLEGDVFYNRGEPVGKLEGLVLTRNDPPGTLTKFRLVRQK